MSPLHYFFGENLHSGELTTPFFMYQSLLKTDHYQVIGITDTLVHYVPQEGEKLIYRRKATKTHFYQLYEMLTFIVFYSFQSTKLLMTHEINIFHHVLPFAIGKTFNPIILLTRFFSPKTHICVGPLQMNDNACHMINKGIGGRFLFFLSISTLKCAHKVVAMNSTTSSYLESIGIESKRIITIPIGIINRKNIPARRYAAIMHKKQLNLITISTLVHRKGTDLLVRAMGELHKAGYPCHLKIIGSGVEMESLRVLSHELGVGKHIEFLGTVPYERLTDCAKDSHIFVSMSRSESFGQMYLDAMDLGLPIIASRNTGSSDIVRPEFGILVDQEDYRALATHIISSIEYPPLLSTMSKTAREAAKAYDWYDGLIDKYSRLVYQ
ncbi:MAG: glycosyltransferase family 4 protein [bacterium]